MPITAAPAAARPAFLGMPPWMRDPDHGPNSPFLRRSTPDAPKVTRDPSDAPLAESSSDALLVRLAARPEGELAAKIDAMPRGADRKAAAWDALTQTAKQTQAPFLAIAEKLKTSGALEGYQTLVSPNMLILDPASGKEREVQKAFGIDGVAAIYANSGGEQQWPAIAGANAPGIAGPLEPSWGYDIERGAAKRPGRGAKPSPIEGSTPAKGPTPGLTLIGAPTAWKQGADGAGLVYGSIDSGVQAEHPALKASYRGTQSDGTMVHDYSWADFLGGSRDKAQDAREHGTHTIGSVVGHTADSQLGVAPGAKFISARATGSGRIDAALRALEWMQAPTKTDGTAPDATKAPDVVGMSWFMGNPTQELFRDSIRNLRLAGVEVVKSAGNKGPGDRTVTSPGQYPEIFAIAAVDSKGKVTDFSSRGPAPFPKGSTTPKPDFAAPGNDILSTVPGGYDTMSGTSMAQPHFSGAVLSILSKYPQLTHDQLTQVLASSATDGGATGHDKEYGAGVINLPGALAAAEKLLAGEQPALPTPTAPAPAEKPEPRRRRAA